MERRERTERGESTGRTERTGKTGKTGRRMTIRQRRRQRRRRRMLAAVMLSVVLLSFTAYFVLGQDKGERESLSGLSSPNAILEEVETGKVLADKKGR